MAVDHLQEVVCCGTAGCCVTLSHVVEVSSAKASNKRRDNLGLSLLSLSFDRIQLSCEGKAPTVRTCC